MGFPSSTLNGRSLDLNNMLQSYYIKAQKIFEPLKRDIKEKQGKGQKGKRAKGYLRALGGETHKTKTNIAADRLVQVIEVAVRRATPPRTDAPGAAS